MHFQKHEYYAFLLMGELVRSGGDRPLSLTEVSRRHGVSLPFLKKIVRSLRASGMVESKEGFGGGYTLARKPQSITLWDVISAFEQRSKPTGSVCPLNTSCLPQHIRLRLTESIKERLSDISLVEAI